MTKSINQSKQSIRPSINTYFVGAASALLRHDIPFNHTCTLSPTTVTHPITTSQHFTLNVSLHHYSDPPMCSFGASLTDRSPSSSPSGGRLLNAAPSGAVLRLLFPRLRAPNALVIRLPTLAKEAPQDVATLVLPLLVCCTKARSSRQSSLKERKNVNRGEATTNIKRFGIQGKDWYP